MGQRSSRSPLYRVANPDRVGELYTPNALAAWQAGLARKSQYAPNGSLLLLIDPQVDFVHPDGKLAVAGAVDDMSRLLAWAWENLHLIDQLVISMDMHPKNHIANFDSWVGPDGQHATPFLPVTGEMVAQGWHSNFPEWDAEYVNGVEGNKRDNSTWLHHCEKGTDGARLIPGVVELQIAWEAMSGKMAIVLEKGTVAEVDFFSIFEAVYPHPDYPETHRNNRLLADIVRFRKIYVAGQAKSHCVLDSIRSISNYQRERGRKIDNVVVLSDAMSTIGSFEAVTEDAYADLQKFRGLQIFKTTEVSMS